MEILHHEHGRTLCRHGFQQSEKNFQGPCAASYRRNNQRRVAAPGRNREQIREERRRVACRDTALDQSVLDAIELRVVADGPVQPKSPLDQLDDGEECAVLRILREAYLQHVDFGVLASSAKFLDKA